MNESSVVAELKHVANLHLSVACIHIYIPYSIFLTICVSARYRINVLQDNVYALIYFEKGPPGEKRYAISE